MIFGCLPTRPLVVEKTVVIVAVVVVVVVVVFHIVLFAMKKPGKHQV